MNVNEWEHTLIQMNYVDAFLWLTMDKNLPFSIASYVLYEISEKHPGSRLSIHARANWRELADKLD